MTHMLEMTTAQIKASVWALAYHRQALNRMLNDMIQRTDHPFPNEQAEMIAMAKSDLAIARAAEVYLRYEADMGTVTDWLYAVAPTQEVAA